MTDLTHLEALRARLSRERAYLADAKTPQERGLRNVWITQIQREIEAEMKFLGINNDVEAAIAEMTDDELLAALTT